MAMVGAWHRFDADKYSELVGLTIWECRWQADFHGGSFRLQQRINRVL
jgi:hypothetical protein